MSLSILIPTGDIIKDYLKENNITNKTFSKKTGLSEKHISNVLKNKCRLTEEFALKLEKVLPSINAEYWLNYEMKYRLDLARQNELYSFSEQELDDVSEKFNFKEIYKGVYISKREAAIETLKLLNISNFSQFDSVFEQTSLDFFEDGGEKEAMAIWLSLCKNEVEIQNDILDDILYKKNNLKKQLNKLKIIANNKNTTKSIDECRNLLNSIGIYFVENEAIKNCKIRGALTTYRNNPAIYISHRFKRHSIIWFSIFHEIAHLILHYNKKDAYVSYEINNYKEKEANSFARSILINENDYLSFVKKNIFTKESIIEFSQLQKTAPCFIVDFLQHDYFIPYSWFKSL